MRRAVALLLVVLGAACSSSGGAQPLDPGVSADELPLNVDSDVTDPVAVITTTIRSLRELVANAHPNLVEEEELLRGGVIPVHLQSQHDTPRCGDDAVTDDELRNNALYCPTDDSMLIDIDGLAQPTLVRHGPVGVALLVAHEAGHAVQQRVGVALDPLVAELNADCFAGIFAAAIADGDTPAWAADQKALARPAYAMLELRDRAGTQPGDPGAHGTGLDRMSSFLDGFRGGWSRCEAYATDPPAVTGLAFTDADEAITGGQTPLSEVLPSAQADLDIHYTRLAAEVDLSWRPTGPLIAARGTGCDGGPAIADVQFCGDDRVVVQLDAIEEVAQKGDVAVRSALAGAWAQEAQLRWRSVLLAGQDGTDCMTGYWLGTHHPGAKTAAEYPFVLPAGGLDEVVELILSGAPETDPLHRLTSLITGFREGRKACEQPSAAATTTTTGPKP